MNLRPLGDRILVRPEANATETESGLALVEHRKPETMGEVIAVGTCAHPLKAEVEAAAERLNYPKPDGGRETGKHCGFGVEGNCNVCQAQALMRALVAREPLVKVGDTVIFSWTAGREVFLDDTGERYLMLSEDDLLAVLEL